MMITKSTWGDFIFTVHSRRRVHRRRKDFASHVKTIWTKSSICYKEIKAWENALDDLLVTLPKVTAVTLINTNLLICRIKLKPLNQSLHILSYINTGHAYYLIRFWENSGHNISLNLLRKFWICSFKVKHSIGHISGMVGPMDMKRNGGALVRYWVSYVTLTFDLTHDLDLCFLKVKYQNRCISGTVIWLMWNKKKTNQ